MIVLTNVQKKFGTKEVLRGINLTVHDGEVVAIIGPSGSGKTTFLRCINFLEQADTGELEIDGFRVSLRKPSRRDVLAVRRKTAMVFQQYNLFKNMTAQRNVELGLEAAQKRSSTDAAEIAKTMLERVGLGHRLDAYPAQLSGGQQQRVGIARAMALNPHIILFDEPTSALDPELVGEVLSTIKELAEQGQTMLIVSHEMSFVRKIADNVVFMDEGLIVEEGSSEVIFSRPQKERTIQFLKLVTDDWIYRI
ncbi:MAG: amino acid ABC transporter ATP-binding protein [Spirochaetaceae bacterium]|jgi:L-cystine transport system ATP-binding protein|nr:amino acid ABC transporter ATP-binding protein [Spirochaetaceae bacterium]